MTTTRSTNFAYAFALFVALGLTAMVQAPETASDQNIGEIQYTVDGRSNAYGIIASRGSDSDIPYGGSWWDEASSKLASVQLFASNGSNPNKGFAIANFDVNIYNGSIQYHLANRIDLAGGKGSPTYRLVPSAEEPLLKVSVQNRNSSFLELSGSFAGKDMYTGKDVTGAFSVRLAKLED